MNCEIKQIKNGNVKAINPKKASFSETVDILGLKIIMSNVSYF